jgi:hypothetical protein
LAIIIYREKSMETMTLSDHAIVRIVDLLQVALLTGTDITDNLRTLRLTIENNKLIISATEEENFQAGIRRLHEQALLMSAEGAGTEIPNV